MDISGFEGILKQVENKQKENNDEEGENVNISSDRNSSFDINNLSSEIFGNDVNDNKGIIQNANVNKVNKVDNNNISLHSGHRQRARERFLLNPQGTSDYDLLELLLFLLIPRADTKPLAKVLIDKYKTIRNVFNANTEELNNLGVNGLSVKYLLTLMSVFNQRLIKQDLTDKTKIANISSLVDYCKSILGHLQEEEFHILFLDAQLHLIDDKKFGFEDVSGVSLNFRDIIKNCINIKTCNVILCHNHPTGKTEPSGDDIETTEKIIDILKKIDVNVIDHIIIGGDNWFSFKQHDLL